jgi:quinol monooxygenase YgiN
VIGITKYLPINTEHNASNNRSKEMIIVMGSIRMGDGEIDRLQSEMAAQMAATHAEDGCELYVFSRDVTDANLLLISERWRDADALAAHSKSPHMATFNKAVGAAKIEHISVKSYEAGTVRTLIGE